MKKIIIIFALFFAFANHSFSYWDNASTINTKKMDLRLMSFSEVGIADNYSIKFHPLAMFVSPSFDLKYSFPNKDLSFFAGINYPTPLLKLVQNKGAGGFISPEFSVPQLFSFRIGYEENLNVNERLNFYTNLYFEYAPTSKLDRSMMIDIPVIAPQMAVYSKGFGINVNVALQGKAIGKFDYYLKMGANIFPFSTEDIPANRKDYMPDQNMNAFVELNPMIIWNLCETFQLAAGAKVTNGDYLFGRTWNTWPHIDFKQAIQF